MVEHRNNIYDYILDTLLELNAPIELKPMKNVLDAYEVREMKVLGALRRVDNEDFSIEYYW